MRLVFSLASGISQSFKAVSRTRNRHRLMAGLLALVILAWLPAAQAVAADNGFIGSANRPQNDGYWLVTARGEVRSFGNAAHYGDMASASLNRPIVGMAATASGFGYWLVAGDGGIFAFGDAAFYGSTGNLHLNKPIVGMAATPSGQGYWMVATDGGIFSYGDAAFYGSTGSIELNKPIVGMSPTADGSGYWMVARDGGIFAFGNADFYGSTGGMDLSQPIVGMSTSPTGHGYWLASGEGGIFAYGDAGFYGASENRESSHAIAIVRTNDGGYGIVRANGTYDARSGPGFAGSQPSAPESSGSGSGSDSADLPGESEGTDDTLPPVTEPSTSTTTSSSTTTTTSSTSTSVPRTTTTSTTAPHITTTSTSTTSTTSTTAPPSNGNNWQLVAQDNFDGTSLNRNYWAVYTGAGNEGVGVRRAEAVRVSDGALHLDGYGSVGSGICWCGPNTPDQTYGRWEIRARMDKGNGYGPATLLWPNSGRWPGDGEIDISEIPKGDRTKSHFTLHYGANNSQQGTSTSTDFSQWHTFGVEWMPDHITYFLDGNAVYTNTNRAAIPTKPMYLALQNDVGAAGHWISPRDANSPQVVSYNVDWIKIYR